VSSQRYTDFFEKTIGRMDAVFDTDTYNELRDVTILVRYGIATLQQYWTSSEILHPFIYLAIKKLLPAETRNS